MGEGPVRTCIGCRKEFSKSDVVRIVAGPDGPVIDYRDKLPGRAAYVCPRRECIDRALSRETLSRALRTRIASVSSASFFEALAEAIRNKIASLIAMAVKAGTAASGYSAVHDALGKGRVGLLIFAADCSEGTRRELLAPGCPEPQRQTVLFTKTELGALVGREEAGVVSINEKGFSDAVWRESERLKNLLNAHP